MEDGLIAMAVVAALALLGAVVLALYYERARRSALAAVDRSREWSTIVEQGNDALLVIDIGNGRVLGTNARACELLRHDRAALLRATIFELCPQELLMRCSERIAEVWEKRGWIFDDIPLLDATGTAIDVECSARVNAFGGRPAIFLYVRDVRERKRLQARIMEQSEELRRRNRDMLDSIQCAQRIQKAMVPDIAAWGAAPPEHFVLFQPRDIVSGDFHWFARRDGLLLAAAADCTGHGVPGALMSMVGATLLNSIVNERGHCAPEKILDQLREGVIAAVGRDSFGAGSHGMDIGLIVLDPRTRILRFAGAQLPCLIARNSGGAVEWIELEPDRMPVGQHPAELRPFSARELRLLPGDSVYLFTDGVADQFGGPDRRRFGKARVRSLIEGVIAQDLSRQRAAIAQAIADWRNNGDQTDDMLMIGLRA
jgi:PAS domain S-box-containing protein